MNKEQVLYDLEKIEKQNGRYFIAYCERLLPFITRDVK